MKPLFRITHSIISNHKIEKECKILLISDIHYSKKVARKKLEFLLEKIMIINPDYVCIPGDLIDGVTLLEDETRFNYFLDWLKKIASFSKVIISMGNHDFCIRKNKKTFYDDRYLKKMKTNSDVIFLDNDFYLDGKILFAGYTASFDYFYKTKGKDHKCETCSLLINELNENKKIVRKLDSNNFNILLMHSPINLENDNVQQLLKDYDIILSGHMHNGCVPPVLDDVIKGNRGIYTPNSGWFKNNTRGIIIKKEQYLIISGGIVKIHATAPKALQWANHLFPLCINLITLKNGRKEYEEISTYEF